MNEKEKIERATADVFINLYNRQLGSSFRVVEYSDAPDIRCIDEAGNKLNFEITLTEDKPRDIAALLGRSDHKSIESERERLNSVRAGTAKPSINCLSGNVVDSLLGKIYPKLYRDYGKNVALVVRDTSAVGWDWELVMPLIKNSLSQCKTPFDQGIWLLNFSKDRIYRLL